MDARTIPIASVLSQLSAQRASAARTATVVAETMHAIHVALAPIIGDQGMSALYRRSLFLTTRDVPWAGSPQSETGASDGYAALQSALSQQNATEALRVAESLFSNLYTILVSLIGVALTQRLLHPMFDILPNGNPVQENTHEQ